jgi:hypothetical protein
MRTKSNIDWAKNMAKTTAAKGVYSYDAQSGSFYQYDGAGNWVPCKMDQRTLGANAAFEDITFTSDELVAFEQELKACAAIWRPLPHDEMVPTWKGILTRNGHTRKEAAQPCFAVQLLAAIQKSGRLPTV